MPLIFAGRVTQFVLLFLTLKVSTSLLAPAEMAKVYLVSSVIALFSMFLLNPVGMFMNRRIHAWSDRGTIKGNYLYFWMYLAVVTGVAYLVLRLFAHRGWVGLSGGGLLVPLIAIYLLAQTVNQVVIPGLNLLEHRVWFVGLTVATTSSALVIAILLVKLFQPKAEYWIAGLAAGQALCSVLGWRVFFSKAKSGSGRGLPSKAQLSVLAAFAVPISISVGLNWVQTQSYRFLMQNTLGLTLLGVFAAGYGISTGIVSAFEAVFTTYLQPMFYRRVAANDPIEQANAWAEYARGIIPSLILIGFLILSLRQELTKILLGSAFQQASRYVGWGVVPEVGRVAIGVYAMIAHARMRTTLLLIPSVVGATVALVLLILLMPLWGARGVGVALLVAAVAAFGCMFLVTRNIFKSSFGFRSVVGSITTGIALFCLAHLLRRHFGAIETNVVALLVVAVIGTLFCAGQFVLLKPILGKY